jgi:iron complex transport system substrate-binding protein
MRRAFLIYLALAFSAAGASPPRRIVSLSPNVTELLYGIGAFDQVVGISDYCTYPPAASKLPKIGGWHDPNLETLLALHPDLVIVDDGQAPFVQAEFKDLGFPLMVAVGHTLKDVSEAMIALGRATGHEDTAAKLVATTREGLLRVSRRTASLPKLRVVLIVDRTPGTLRDLFTATDGGFLGELVEIAGGRIALPAARRGYGKLSKEDLLAANPDIILDFVQGAKGSRHDDPMEVWREIPELKAVRNRRVYGVNEDYVPHASQRVVQTAELFARLIHPEAK